MSIRTESGSLSKRPQASSSRAAAVGLGGSLSETQLLRRRFPMEDFRAARSASVTLSHAQPTLQGPSCFSRPRCSAGSSAGTRNAQRPPGPIPHDTSTVKWGCSLAVWPRAEPLRASGRFRCHFWFPAPPTLDTTGGRELAHRVPLRHRGSAAGFPLQLSRPPTSSLHQTRKSLVVHPPHLEHTSSLDCARHP